LWEKPLGRRGQPADIAKAAVFWLLMMQPGLPVNKFSVLGSMDGFR
jgi:hypothetical protein